MTDTGFMEWGGWRVSVHEPRLTAPHEAKLSPSAQKALVELMAAGGETLTYRAIALRVTPLSTNPYGLASGLASLLRKALGPHAIRTVPGVGFRLMTAAEAADEARKALEANEARKAESARLLQESLERQKLPPSQRRDRLVVLFKDQFEATGPHARSVAAMVLVLFGEPSR